MKKEARTQARNMYLNTGGKISNIDIAKAVNVNALTIGRWKQKEKWENDLVSAETVEAKDVGGVIRKKAARDMAMTIYLDAAGKISNKELAKRVGASPATIAKWKDADEWILQLEAEETKPESPDISRIEADLDIAQLANPEQIIEINRRIDIFLKREHLSSGEIADLAGAKSDLLTAVEIYLSIVRETGPLGASK